MFNHKVYQEKFLHDYNKGEFHNNSVAFVARTLELPRYQIIGIHHLLPHENEGKHHLFMDVINLYGARKNNVKIEWGWEGQRSYELVNPAVLDKPPHEPATNIALGFEQIAWARVLGANSDTVSQVTTKLPDEQQGNTLGHHSYYVVWAFVEGTQPTPEPDESDDIDWEEKFKALAKWIKDMAEGL